MIDKSKITKEFLAKDEIDFYNKYIEDIRNRMERSDFLGTFTHEDLEFLLDNNSHIYLYKYNDDIMCTSMIIPAREKDIKKFGLNYNYQDVIDYGPEVVLDKYRGNGLQRYMLEDLDRVSKKLGYKYAVTTIHPENIYSINNLTKHGFKQIGRGEFKRGPRNIYCKELH